MSSGIRYCILELTVASGVVAGQVPRQLEDEIAKMESRMGKQGRREMLAGLVAAAGLESQRARAETGQEAQGSSFPFWFVLLAPPAVFGGI